MFFAEKALIELKSHIYFACKLKITIISNPDDCEPYYSDFRFEMWEKI